MMLIALSFSLLGEGHPCCNKSLPTLFQFAGRSRIA